MSQRADYEGRINRVIDHIEAHIDEPLRLDDLARVACFSRFHFHRLFTAMTGETLGQFVSRLRLERSASQLLQSPDRSITEVALDSGFGSSASFARAFKGRFGVSATDWRRSPSLRKMGNADRKDGQAVRNPREAVAVSSARLDPVTSTLHWRIEMKTASNLKAEVEVRDTEPMEVAYVRHVGPYAGDAALFGRLFGKLMGWAGPRGLIRPDAACLTVYHDNPGVTQEEKLRTSVCLQVPPGTPVEGDVGLMTLPGGPTAFARFELSADQFGDAWQAVYGGWLPESGYQPDDRPAFELCLNNPAEHPEGKHIVEICVPVRA